MGAANNPAAVRAAGRGLAQQSCAAKNKMGGGSPRRPFLCWVCRYQFLVMRIPKRRGSVTKTLVVSAVSSEFRNAPVIAVVSSTFFT